MKDDKLSRRALLRAGAGAALVPPLATLAPTAQALAAVAPTLAAGLFFSAAEMALLDELTEQIIPRDEHSGGARDAEVAAFLDRTLAERDPAIAPHAEERERFRAGLRAVDELARSLVGKPFLEASAEEKTAVLTRMAESETDPQTAVEKFFVELKRATALAYYSSRLGIHDEIEYKGNRLLRRFVGVDVSRR